MGKIRSFFARLIAGALKILTLVGVFVLTAFLVFIMGLVVTAFPCLAVFCIVQLCGPVLKIGVIWLIAAAAVWAVFEVTTLIRYIHNKKHGIQEEKKDGGTEENKAV